MQDVTTLALRSFTAATTRQDAEAAAVLCELAADQDGHAPPQTRDHQDAATLLRRLSSTVARSPHGPRFSYNGRPVRLDPSRIADDKMITPDKTDPECGHATAALFNEAVASGAVIAPPGITVECLGDDDTDGGGFIPIARPAGTSRGVTCGWCDVANIHGASPVEALAFIVQELNRALGAPPERCPDCGCVLRLRTGEQLLALRDGAPPHAPAHTALCEDQIGLRCTNVECERFACYLEMDAAAPPPTRVAVAAQNPFVRDALAQIIAADQRRQVVAATGAPAESLAGLADSLDVLVVEITAHGGHTLADLDSISQALPGVRVVVLPGYGAPQLETLRPWATGALIEADLLAVDASTICHAIVTAADGS